MRPVNLGKLRRGVRFRRRPDGRSQRRGAATLDYVLVLGVAAALSGMALYQSGRIIRAVYAFTCTFIAWPFQ